jgi:hypothetical protein
MIYFIKPWLIHHLSPFNHWQLLASDSTSGSNFDLLKKGGTLTRLSPNIEFSSDMVKRPCSGETKEHETLTGLPGASNLRFQWVSALEISQVGRSKHSLKDMYIYVYIYNII